MNRKGVISIGIILIFVIAITLIVFSFSSDLFDKPLLSPSQTASGVDCAHLPSTLPFGYGPVLTYPGLVEWFTSCPCKMVGDWNPSLNVYDSKNSPDESSPSYSTNACEVCKGGEAVGKPQGTPFFSNMRDSFTCKVCDGNGGTENKAGEEPYSSYPWSFTESYSIQYPSCFKCNSNGELESKPVGTVVSSSDPYAPSCLVCDSLGRALPSASVIPPKPVEISDISYINVVFDSDFVNKTKERRGFTPQTPFTPYDDIRVNIGINKNGCNLYPDQLPFDSALVFTNTSGQEEVFPFTGGKVPVKVREDNSFVEYSLLLSGWSYSGAGTGSAVGIIPQNIPANVQIMERMIEAVAKEFTAKSGKNVVKFRVMEEGDHTIKKDETIPMGNCLQMYGDGKIKFASLRGESANISSFDLLLSSRDSVNEGFNSVDPFKTYNDSFSHYTDLKNIKDNSWLLIGSYQNGIYAYGKRNIERDSSCGKGFDEYIFYNERTYEGVAPPVGGIVYIEEGGDPETVMHETGHAFCGVKDEYVYEGSFTRFLGRLFLSTRPNCVIDPKVDFLYKGKMYGDTNFKGCTNKLVYRSTGNSMMNYQWSTPKFNVVSCGYCLSKIKGGYAKDLWDECSQLDTEKPSVISGI